MRLNAETINQALTKNSNDLKRSQDTSQPCWVTEIRQRYGTADEILKTFSPSRQSEFAKARDKCLTGHAPSVARLARAYGHNIAVAWLELQLVEVGETCGARKQDVAQLQSTAEALICEYGYLKMTEWMLFFSKLKIGVFGSFYGAVDSMRIGECLKEFLTWRSGELARIERERREAERRKEEERESRETLTYDEWQTLRWYFNM